MQALGMHILRTEIVTTVSLTLCGLHKNDVWRMAVVNNTYFFGHKSFFSFQNLKNPDPSYKMTVDLWDCLGREKHVL